MQTWVTDKDFYKSASNLTRQHLQANIYESIQILASLLNINDKLVNPKKNVKNYPQARLWNGYEVTLYKYITQYLFNWYDRKYMSYTNSKNIMIIFNYMLINNYLDKRKTRHKKNDWITDELIQTHRSVLIQKEIEKDKKMIKEANKYRQELNPKELLVTRKFMQNYHYRNLWPDCPRDLKMRYDFREKN
jgi:hypothetical protein